MKKRLQICRRSTHRYLLENFRLFVDNVETVKFIETVGPDEVIETDKTVQIVETV